MEKCRICNKPADRPYRVYDTEGNIVQGCIDASHSPHLALGTRDYKWHHRNEAVRIRRTLTGYQPPVVTTLSASRRALQVSMICNAFAAYRHPLETF